ncbi:elongation of very long chain fatty acids protein 4 [Nephila pilipes]|uniref:Elongation of very long chain fatty acids protein n=1 Tax=Nephila pilipes TaxID=299642 RepID=A0A8X6QNX6_NEPPI|nr:elongation of very long chain fatty acids protein 4 [Nephila pilipes]
MLTENMSEFFFDYDLNSKLPVRYPSIPLTIIALYVLFVKWIGPSWMKDREPFKLRRVMIVYNFILSMANIYFSISLIILMIQNRDLMCLNEENRFHSSRMENTVRIRWHAFLERFCTLFDTIFLVLRKKDSHVSILHVFHHVIVCLLCTLLINAEDLGFFVALVFAINSTVHVIMHFYYGLAAFGPSMRKYLWWKKYLTLLQIGQFVFALLYMFITMSTGCEERSLRNIVFVSFCLALLVLFINFYHKGYSRKKD